MASERPRRRRRRRRPNRPPEQPGPAVEQSQQRPPSEEKPPDVERAPGLLSRFKGRRGAPHRQRGRGPGRIRRPRVSPLTFWRRRSPRPLRERPLPREARIGLWRRLTGFYFPPWVPVVGVIVAVFALLGVFFFLREATANPRVGDHWHAPYAVFIGTERQPNIPEYHSQEGPHTHGDGVYHIHPFSGGAGEGRGAAIDKLFEYGGGKLTSSELQMPGETKVYRKGDPVPGDGRPGVVRILQAHSGLSSPVSTVEATQACDSKAESEFQQVKPRYIPQDGDCIRVIFGPGE